MTSFSEPASLSTPELSFAQERMWFLEQLESDRASTNCATTIDLAGALCVARLEQCVNRIIRRHEALRTAFVTRGGRPTAAIEPAADLAVRLVDLAGLAVSDAAIQRLALEDAARVFALDRPPLLRLTLFRAEPARHILQLTTHHIVWDAWSVTVFLQELRELYESMRQGTPSRLTALPAHYQSFARAERERIETPAAEHDLAFWRARLADRAPLALPADAPRPAVPRFRGRTQAFVCSEELSDALDAFCAAHRASPFMVVLSALQVFLSLLTGASRVAVGVPVANRARREWEPLIGAFVNLLVFRTEVREGETSDTLVPRVREEALSVYEHAAYPFAKLVDALNPPRDTAGTPFVDALLVFLNALPPRLSLAGVSGTLWNIETIAATQDLTLTISPQDGRLHGAWTYNRDRFLAETIERFSRHFARVLEAIVRRDPLSPALLVDDEERAQLAAWNRTARIAWRRGTLARLVALDWPDDTIALACGDRQISYGALRRQVAGCARRLRAEGAGPERPIGILVERSPELIVAQLAALACGAPYVPIDERWPVRRQASVADAARLHLLVTDRPRALAEARPLRCVAIEWDPRAPAVAAADLVRLAPVTPESAAYTMFTSGSTGEPKGIEIPHEAVWNLLASFADLLRPQPGERWLAVTAASFDIALLEWALPLSTGGCVVLASHDDVRDPRTLAASIAAHAPAYVQATPSLWRMLVESGWSGGALGALTGGEALAEDLAAALRARCRRLWNVYGPTETTVWSTAGLVDAGAPDLGDPIGNTTIHLLSPAGAPVPLGIDAEIVIGGAGLARGYLRDPARTAERFVPDPFSPEPGARLFRTGDVARRGADGRLRFRSRADAQMKVRGVRVEAGEIEACLRSHPAIADAVVALEGSGSDARLIGYVTPRPSMPEDRRDAALADLPAFLAERLPDPLVPAQVVLLDALPLTTSGKVDRARLPVPQPAARTVAAPGLLSPLEQEVRAAWTRALPHARPQASDNFFDLGGNSILAAQVCLTLTSVLGIHVPVSLMFTSPVFEQFTARLREPGTAEAVERLPSVAPDRAHRFDPFPLTDVQEAYLLGRSGVFALGGVSTHSYFEVDTTRIDVDRFEAAWRALVRRHDMLRAVFSPSGTQRVLPSVPDYVVRRLDLSRAAPDARERELQRVRDEMSHAVHPSDRWPLFEIRATRLSDTATRYHVSLDALIGDAFSSTLLFAEWQTFYRDPDAVLDEPAITFRDYVMATRALERTERYGRSEAYWIGRLDETFRGPDLPILPTSGREASSFARRSATLPPAAWQRLRAHALAHGLSPTTVVLAAFADVLSIWSRTQRFTLNLTLFNRLPLHPDVNRLVGDFTSITLLGIDALTPATFEQMAARTQAQLWEDLDHRLFSGIRVLREARRRLGGGQDVLAPVVFTSTLGMTGGAADADGEEPWGQEVFSISQTPQVWLDHKVFEDGDGLGLDWDVAAALFPDGVIDAMFQAYTRLLTMLAEEEESWRIDRRVLHDRVLGRVSAAAGPPTVRFEGADTLHGLFLEQARRQPAAVAAIARDRSVTYGELSAWSASCAARLRDAGLRREELVAVVAPKGWEQALAMLGILRAGGAYLPIDPGEPEDRRFHMLQSARVRFALTTPDVQETLRWPEDCRPLPLTAPASRREAAADPPPDAGDVAVPGDRLAYVIFTSGSTGRPKGVMIEHRAAVNTLRDLARRLDLGPSDRTLALSALSFDLSVFDAFGMWAAGGAIVYPDPARAKDPSHWAALLAAERITIWNTVPALMEMLVEATTVRETPLRWVLLSGDWIPVSLPSRMAPRWPAARRLSLGGATEASIWSILHPMDRVDPAWVRIPYGRAMWNQSVTVLNERFEATPTWTVGEIFIGGIGVARGYLGNPVLTQERFFAHPASGERLYRTGDLGRLLSSGEIDILGRADHQVKINGYRVELPEIEAVLDAQPGIHQAIVTLERDAAGHPELVAYLVEPPPASATSGDPANTANTADAVAAVGAKLSRRANWPSAHAGETLALEPDADPRARERTLARQSYRVFAGASASKAALDAWLTRVETRLSTRPAPAGAAARTRAWLQHRLQPLAAMRVEGTPFPKRRYPSAGSLYPVQTYVGIPEAAIADVPGGIYYYDPYAHRLGRIGDLASVPRGTRPRVTLVAELGAIEDVYHDASWRFCALEAGYMRALWLDTPLRESEPFEALRLASSQRTIATYELDADLAAAMGPADAIGRLLLWVGPRGLDGLEPGFYRRDPGRPLARVSGDAAIDPAWFGPNRDLFGRSQFALVCVRPAASAAGEAPAPFIEAGLLGQLLMEEAPACDLGLCPIGEISNALLAAAGADGEILHGWMGGRIDPAQARTWAVAEPRLDRETLRQRCRDAVGRSLPSYMHPVRYLFVDRVPLTPNHKVDRAVLKLHAQPDDAAPLQADAGEGSDLEREIAALLEGILKRPVRDYLQSFFDMGASSLIITQLYGMVNDRYPDRVSFQDLFDNPSIREAARLIEAPAAAPSPAPAAEVIDL